MTDKRPIGRPSKRTPELIDKICEQLAEGKSLRELAAADDIPSVGTIMRWLTEDEKFQEQYVRARELQADAMFDAVVGIADGADEDTVQVARLQIDARKWAAGKLRPKVYGDKLQTENNHTFSPEVASWLGLTS